MSSQCSDISSSSASAAAPLPNTQVNEEWQHMFGTGAAQSDQGSNAPSSTGDRVNADTVKVRSEEEKQKLNYDDAQTGRF